MTVENIIGCRGNKVVNQFVLKDKNCIAFQSYDSLICEVFTNNDCTKVVHLYPNWNYSTTTAKYLYIFLKDYAECSVLASRKDILEAIERGHARMDESIFVMLESKQVYN